MQRRKVQCDRRPGGYDILSIPDDEPLSHIAGIARHHHHRPTQAQSLILLRVSLFRGRIIKASPLVPNISAAGETSLHNTTSR
jgi:hypothetical protein